MSFPNLAQSYAIKTDTAITVVKPIHSKEDPDTGDLHFASTCDNETIIYWQWSVFPLWGAKKAEDQIKSKLNRIKSMIRMWLEINEIEN